MSIDSTGLTIKRYPDIVSELETSLRSYLGPNIDLSEDALLGILNIIYANSQAEQWELAQAVYNAFNIEGAQGKQLDDLVALVGLSRLPAAKTTGLVEFTSSTNGLVVPAGFEVTTNDTDISVFTDEELNINNNDCYRAQVTLPSINIPETYVVNVNGTPYSYESQSGDTADVVMAKLVDAINFDVEASWGASVIVGQGYFTIVADSVTLPLTIIVGVGLGFANITSVVRATVEDEGDINIFENTLTIFTPLAGLESTNNTLPFDRGRLEETDEELRIRHSQNTSIIGSSSKLAIEAQLRNIQGVTFAEVLENTTIFTDARGLPAKSFEAIVDGSTDEIIANTILNIKPAGIQTYGNRSVAVDDQIIFFTRPINVLFYVDVTYTLYDEEVFPPNGVDLIRQAVLAHSNTIELGEDIIGQRFYGEIYRTVAGIQSLDVKLGFTSGTVTDSILPINETSRGFVLEENIDIILGS